MLESLDITNFQKHSTYHIDFDPYLTVLVGPTNIGKSSLLRAIRWCMLNTPSGDSFIKQGESFTSVKLKVDNHTIERKRGKGE